MFPFLFSNYSTERGVMCGYCYSTPEFIHHICWYTRDVEYIYVLLILNWNFAGNFLYFVDFFNSFFGTASEDAGAIAILLGD